MTYPTCTFHVGDALTVMRTLPDASVDVVISSPPFLGIRSYLPAGHPDKDAEMGSEATPGEFIDALLDVVEEADRLLAPHGSLVFELGDTYAGSGGAGGDYGPGGLRDGQQRFDGSASKAYRTGAAPRPARNRWRSPGPDPRYPQRGEQSRGTGAGGDWPIDKSLCLIPELLRFSLAYGLNPLTGRQTPRWRVRNVIRWHRPNPPVGALGDKVRPSTSDLVVACKSRTRYFDLDACRTAAVDQRHRNTNGTKQVAADPAEVMTANFSQRVPSNPGGAPPLDTWIIPTHGYPGAHYATYPPALVEKVIKLMCPERVCEECGEPSRRITEPLTPLLGTGYTRTRADLSGRPIEFRSYGPYVPVIGARWDCPKCGSAYFAAYRTRGNCIGCSIAGVYLPDFHGTWEIDLSWWSSYDDERDDEEDARIGAAAPGWLVVHGREEQRFMIGGPE